MTMVAMSDFPDDVSSQFEPLFNAVGLLDNDGNLDLNNFSLDNLKTMFGNSDRVSYLLAFLESVLGTPSLHSRREFKESDATSASGIFTQTYDVTEIKEEWFKITSIPLGVNALDIHLVTNFSSTSSTDYTLDLGLGIDFETVLGSSNGLYLDAKASIPLFRVECASGVVTFDPLIWADDPALQFKALSRIAIEATLSGWNGSETAPLLDTGPLLDSVGISLAFGKSGFDLELRALGFGLTATSVPENMIFNDWSGSGSISAVLQSLIQQVINALPTELRTVFDLIGLTKPTDEPDWPTIDLAGVFQNAISFGPVSFDGSVIVDAIEDWFNRLMTEGFFGDWINRLLSFIAPPSAGANVTGDGTESNPWKIDLDALFGIGLSTGPDPGFDINFVAYYELDANGRFDVHLGLEVLFSQTKTSGPNFSASLTAWLAKISFGGGGGFAFAFDPNIEFLLNLYGNFDPVTNVYERITPTKQITINGTDYDFYAGSVHAGAGFTLGQGLTPVLEVRDVQVGTTTFASLDLLSSDTPADILAAVTDTVEHMLVSLLSDGGVLQMLGSLVGLVSPRGTSTSSFATNWDPFLIDALDLIGSPIDRIKKFYGTLATSSFTHPGTSETVNALAVLFDSICSLMHMFIGNIADLPDDTAGFGFEQSTDSDGFTHYVNEIARINNALRLSLEYSVNQTTGEIEVNLLPILMQKQISSHLEVTASLPVQFFSGQFTANGNSYDLSSSFLNELAFEARLSSTEGRIQLLRLGSIAIGFDDLLAYASWNRGSGFHWEIDLENPGLSGFYPDLQGLVDDDPALTDACTKYEKLCSFDWDGIRVEELYRNDSHVINSDDPITVEVDMDRTFELQIVEETLTISSVGFGSNGFDVDLTGINLADFNGFLTQMLVQKGGRLGMFLAVFFGTHPDVVYLNLGPHATTNGYTIPAWYSTPATGDWPAQWRQMHRSNPSRFGLGPLAVPLDWPCIDMTQLQADPLQAIRNHMLALFSSTSSSGELFCFSAMRWLYALFNGHIPTLNRPDLGWGISTDTTLGNEMLDVPDIPLRFVGGGSYKDPWKIPLIQTPKGSIDFILWLGPDGPPASMLAQMTSRREPPDLNEIMNSVSIPIGSGSATSADIEKLVDVLYEVSSYSSRFRAAVGGRPKTDLLASMLALDAHWKSSDGITPVTDQEADWAGSTTTVSNQIVAHGLDATASSLVVAEATSILESLTNAPSKLILTHPPWQSPLIWYPLIQSIKDSTSLSINVSVDQDGNINLGDHIVSIPNDVTLDTSTVPSQDLLIVHLEDSSTWETYAQDRITELISLIGPSSSNRIVAIGHSVACNPLRNLSSNSFIQSIIGVGAPDPTTQFDFTDSLWEDAVNVLKNLGI